MSGVITKLGRPSAMTEDVIRFLETALAHGLSVTEACLLAGIHRDTFYARLAKSEAFAVRMERAKSLLNIAAKEVIFNSIVKDENVSTAKWFLSHRDPDYGARARCQFCSHKLRTDDFSDTQHAFKNPLSSVSTKTVSEKEPALEVPILSVL